MKSNWYALRVSCLIFGFVLTAQIAQAQTCAADTSANNPTAAYSITSDTVTDTRTGLIWDRCAWGLSGADCAVGSAITMTWPQALALPSAANANFHKTYSDWRLPNIRELASLLEHCRVAPTINEFAFPKTPALLFWSNSPVEPVVQNSWVVEFSTGNVGGNTRSGTNLVRLVRAGQ